MESTPPPHSESLFTTLEQIREAHARLLDRDSDDTPPEPKFWLDVRAFAVQVAESGIYFGEPHEVKACQGYLSYWEHELSRAKAEKQFSGDTQIPELRPYDEAALHALQSRYANPFEGLAAEAEATLPKDAKGTCSVEELARLIEGKAADRGLRFELDLVKEITNQVAGDSYAPKLVEFCLYHLFEDPTTRVGNKLHRPPRERSFGCRQYLVEKAESLHGRQEPDEQQAMLRALSLYGASFDPTVPSDAIISAPRIDGVKGAKSPTFKDVSGRSLALRPFLVSSRLLFTASGLSVVHPALFRHWPILREKIGVRHEREKTRRRVWMYGFAAIAAMSFAFGFTQYRALQDEEDTRAANELAVRSYTKSYTIAGEERLKMALKAAERSPTPTTKTALNEAIWAMLAANARTAPPGEALAGQGSEPSVVPCGGSGTEKRSLCLVNSRRERVTLPDLAPDDNKALGIGGKDAWVAVAWPSYGSSNPGKIQLAAFHVSQGIAERVGKIRDTGCEGTVAKVRVSPKGSAVTVDCFPVSEGRLWALLEVKGDASHELVIAPKKLDEERDSIQAVYFASPGERGLAALKDGGVLEVTTDTGKKSFRSDILRVMSRPGHLAFRRDRGFAAVGAFNAPLVLVHEETDRAMERDMIYAVPQGLGSATGVEYSPNGKCIAVHTEHEGKAFVYHIILDAEMLKAIAQELVGRTPRYEAWRCG